MLRAVFQFPCGERITSRWASSPSDALVDALPVRRGQQISANALTLVHRAGEGVEALLRNAGLPLPSKRRAAQLVGCKAYTSRQGDLEK